MFTFRSALPLIFGEKFWKKVIAYSILFFIGYILRDFLILFFVTFLFAYIFLEMAKWVSAKIASWTIDHTQKPKKPLSKNSMQSWVQRHTNVNIVVTILYIIFICIIIFIFVNIIPKIGLEVRNFLGEAPRIARQGQDFVENIERTTNLHLGLRETVEGYLNGEILRNMGEKAINSIRDAGVILTKFLIALLLSYLFIIDRKKIEGFLGQIRNGNFQFLYDEWSIVAKKMGDGFGMILKAQSIIAVVNAVLTTIGLLIISFVHGGQPFPFIFTLSLIVFICGFIPVFGTFFSGVPIIILGYSYGTPTGDGFVVVIACMIMIAVVHAVEAYYLNPKIVSSYVHFPIFITLIILLIAEHFFGLIGLLIGVPLTWILIGLIEDFDEYISDMKGKMQLLK